MTQEVRAVSHNPLLTKDGDIAWTQLAANDDLPPARAASTTPLSFALADLVRGLARAERILTSGRPTLPGKTTGSR